MVCHWTAIYQESKQGGYHVAIFSVIADLDIRLLFVPNDNR